jgi:hypothetical protein
MTQQQPTNEQQDAAEFKRVADGLKGAFDEPPEADRTALWSVVESRLGPQQVPWHVALRSSITSLSGGFRGPIRQMALAGAAVAVVGALLLSGVFESRNRASAAVLDQVTDLSAAADAALADGTLSAEEIADLHERALALLMEIESDPEALNVLTPTDLKLVIELLSIVGDDLDDFVDDDHGELDDDFDEAVESILESTGLAETFRSERGDDDDEDGADGDDGDDGEQPAAQATAEADETSEATRTPEADESNDDEEANGTPEADATSEAAATPEADETPETDGTAESDEDDEEPDSSETSTTIAADEGTYSFAAGAAGDVMFSFDGDEFEVVSVSEAAGWESDVSKPEGEEIRVEFRSGDQRLAFSVELNDGEIRIKTKLRSIEGDDND